MVTFILTDVAPTAPLRFRWTIHREDVPALDWIELRLKPRPSLSSRTRTGVPQAANEDGRLQARRLGDRERGRDLAIHWEETRGQPTGHSEIRMEQGTSRRAVLGADGQLRSRRNSSPQTGHRQARDPMKLTSKHSVNNEMGRAA